MPHVILKTSDFSREIFLNNLPVVYRLENYLVKFNTVFFDAKYETALVETLIIHNGRPQNFYCRITRHDNGKVVVGLDPLPKIERSPGVQMAVAGLGFWVKNRLPEAEITQTNLRRYLQVLECPREEQSEKFRELLTYYRKTVQRVQYRAIGARQVLAESEFLQPCHWDYLFGNKNPVEIEIGPGKGRFLLAEAEKRPEVNFFAIEWTGRYVRDLLTRLGRKRSPNIRIAHADAAHLFREWIPENSVQAVHIYFPDPWWKRRQAKYRLLTPEFIQNLEKRLQARGTFCFATDIQDYFTRVLEMMKNFPNFEKAFERHYSPEDAENPNRSNFETKMRLKGRWIFEAHWVNWLGESITS